jgi:phosphomannomutase/phosphomannomutase/phosphoglucomutase
LSYLDIGRLHPLKVVVNAGNGGAGAIIDSLERSLPFEFVKLNHEPDGTFPNGVPNPLLPENREVTSTAVVAEQADLGIAWDGDFDRCFFFDERGSFVEGYYLVGLLAERALRRHPGARVVHDPRLVWNTQEVVAEHGGVPVVSKSGHAFIKEKMREVDGAYGGEMSAHHYFREFSYCDSGMIPWLQVVERMCEEGRPLSEMVQERIARYPVSGEINLELKDPKMALEAIRRQYEQGALSVSELDGMSFEYARWRFNVRPSNTEPVVRLNVESRGDEALMLEKTAEVAAALERSQ